MKSVYLFDINVLIALTWPSHIHHAQAHEWLSAHAHAKWATCPMTQCGFVRISSNPKIIAEAVSVRDALQKLAQITSMKHHVFWSDTLSLSDLDEKINIYGHQQVTDVYLLALAMKHGGRLVTLDKRIQSLLEKPAQQHHRIELISI